MKKSSAPGKVFLFGEHAVVYGEPAVLCTIDRRVTVTASRIGGTNDVIEAHDLGFSGIRAEFGAEGDLKSDSTNVGDSLAYVREAAQKARRELESDSRLEIEVESELPVGAGLGSSAAVTVATIHAVMRELGGELRPERIAKLGHEVELEVQGSASPSDTFASTTGGMVYVEPNEELRALDTPEFEFVIGYDGKSAPTGEMVAMVRRLTQETEVANDVMRSIGKITLDGVKSVQSGNLERTGQLMDLNHGLLEALGVGTSSLSSMVWAARDSGAYGAKLTGAGGGGCTVALSDPGKSGNIVAGVGTVADEVFKAEVGQGVRAE